MTDTFGDLFDLQNSPGKESSAKPNRLLVYGNVFNKGNDKSIIFMQRICQPIESLGKAIAFAKNNYTTPEKQITNYAVFNKDGIRYDLKDKPVNSIYFTLGRFTPVKAVINKTSDIERVYHARIEEAMVDADMYAVDLDIGSKEHQYPDQAAALRDYMFHVKQSAVPLPYMVNSSGNGIHIIYKMSEFLPRDTWLSLGKGIQSRLVSLGIKSDPATFTVVQPIRLPFSWNDKTYKGGGVVRSSILKTFGAVYTAEELRVAFNVDADTATPAAALDSITPLEIPGLHDDTPLGEGINPPDRQPRYTLPLLATCPSMRHYAEIGDVGDYSAWQTVIAGVCAKLEDGRALAHRISHKWKSGSKAYDPDDVDQKYDSANYKGWLTCETFHSYTQCDQCLTCPRYIANGHSFEGAVIRYGTRDGSRLIPTVDKTYDWFVDSKRVYYTHKYGTACLEAVIPKGDEGFRWYAQLYELNDKPLTFPKIYSESNTYFGNAEYLPEGNSIDYHLRMMNMPLSATFTPNIIPFPIPSIAYPQQTHSRLTQGFFMAFVSGYDDRPTGKIIHTDVNIGWSKEQDARPLRLELETNTVDKSGVYTQGSYSVPPTGRQPTLVSKATSRSGLSIGVAKKEDLPAAIEAYRRLVDLTSGEGGVLRTLAVTSLVYTLASTEGLVESVESCLPLVNVFGGTGAAKTSTAKIIASFYSSDATRFLLNSSGFSTRGYLERGGKLKHLPLVVDEAATLKLFEGYAGVRTADPYTTATAVMDAIKEMANGQGRVIAEFSAYKDVQPHLGLKMFIGNNPIMPGMSEYLNYKYDPAAMARLYEMPIKVVPDLDTINSRTMDSVIQSNKDDINNNVRALWGSQDSQERITNTLTKNHGVLVAHFVRWLLSRSDLDQYLKAMLRITEHDDNPANIALRTFMAKMKEHLTAHNVDANAFEVSHIRFIMNMHWFTIATARMMADSHIMQESALRVSAAMTINTIDNLYTQCCVVRNGSLLGALHQLHTVINTERGSRLGIHTTDHILTDKNELMRGGQQREFHCLPVGTGHRAGATPIVIAQPTSYNRNTKGSPYWVDVWDKLTPTERKEIVDPYLVVADKNVKPPATTTLNQEEVRQYIATEVAKLGKYPEECVVLFKHGSQYGAMVLDGATIVEFKGFYRDKNRKAKVTAQHYIDVNARAAFNARDAEVEGFVAEHLLRACKHPVDMKLATAPTYAVAVRLDYLVNHTYSGQAGGTDVDTLRKIVLDYGPLLTNNPDIPALQEFSAALHYEVPHSTGTVSLSVPHCEWVCFTSHAISTLVNRSDRGLLGAKHKITKWLHQKTMEAIRQGDSQETT